ncbi:MAG: VOC family protein [Rhizobiaceae bacterium]|nr:VOC family protein [Rhizobiaceae bacterium]
MTQFRQTIPILRSFDEAKAKAFYVGWLGFSVDFEHRFEPGMPLYMQLSRGALTLHVSEHHGDATPGSSVFVWMTGLRDFHAEIMARPYPNMRPGIEEMPWDAWCVTVLDPFGNSLKFNEKKSV